MSQVPRICVALFLSLSASLVGCDKGPKKDQPEVVTKTASGEDKANDSTEGEDVPATGEVKVDGKVYGAGVKASETVKISEIAADPTAYEGKSVRVEGMVTDVCVKRGCWFEMAGQKPGEKIRFKVTDGEMVFPVSSKGQHAVAEGKIVTRKLSLEETRAREEHFAKESGRDFDPQSITEGALVYMIDGSGAVIGDKK